MAGAVRRLRSADPVDRVSAALAFIGLESWSERQVAACTGLGGDEIEQALAALTADGALVDLQVGPRRTVRVLAEYAIDLEDRALRALSRLHAARPRHSSIPRAQLAAAMPDLANDSLVAGLIERLKAQKRVIADARAVALRDFQPRLSNGERKLKAELAEAIRAGGLTPPEVAELAASAGSRAAAVADLLGLLRDEDQIVQISAQLFLDATIEGQVRERLAGRLGDGSAITMSELRDLLGTTRKYSVPIAEYLDRIGFTIRDGDTRRLNPACRAVLT